MHDDGFGPERKKRTNTFNKEKTHILIDRFIFTNIYFLTKSK